MASSQTFSVLLLAVSCACLSLAGAADVTRRKRGLYLQQPYVPQPWRHQLIQPPLSPADSMVWDFARGGMRPVMLAYGKRSVPPVPVAVAAPPFMAVAKRDFKNCFFSPVQCLRREGKSSLNLF